MSFLTIKYFVFLAIALAAYFAVYAWRPTFQWAVLLMASYYFYSCSSIKFLLFLLLSTFITWIVAIGLNESNLAADLLLLQKPSGGKPSKDEQKAIQKRRERQKQCWIACGILINLGILGVLKYGNFSILTMNHILGLSVSTFDGAILPLGLSFYTFQSLGYCLDVYRGSVKAEHNFFKYALFVAFFPQLCEGPIGDYNKLSPQLLLPHAFDYGRFAKGLIRILLGLFKKVVVADTLAQFIDPVYENSAAYSGFILVSATVFYSLQLYADFSGYIDIALGTAGCFGIGLAENFDTPYFSTSISEFWRRWHISLGAWFRNYLYYPVLRSPFIRKLTKKLNTSGHKKLANKITATIGLFITWTLIGIWHGAGYKYIAYGWYHGFFIILAVWCSDLYKNMKQSLHIKERKLFTAFRTVRTFIIVTAGYVIFRSDSLSSALLIYKRIFMDFYYAGALEGLYVFSRGTWIILLICIFVCIALELMETKNRFGDWIFKKKWYVRWPVLYILLGMTLIWFLVRPADAGNFIYFNF